MKLPKPWIRLLSIALAIGTALAPLAATAQTAIPDSAAAAPPSIERARELISNGEYDEAILILKDVIKLGDRAMLGEAYLLRIKAHVYLGNHFKFQDQGRVTADLQYREAESLVAEVLGIRELRHLQPSATDPPEMVRAFADVRNRLFGAFRVTELSPAHAVVILDGDTLRAAAGDSLPSDVDLRAGKHLVVVRAVGYKDVTDDVTIDPGSTLARGYTLEKRRGTMWYATRSAGTLGVVGGLIALLAGKEGSKTTPEQPLPGPPDPPPTR
jgi:hypothetical protein